MPRPAPRVPPATTATRPRRAVAAALRRLHGRSDSGMFEPCSWPRFRARRTRSSSTWGRSRRAGTGSCWPIGILVAILVTRRQLALRERDPALAGRGRDLGRAVPASSARGSTTSSPTGRRSRATSSDIPLHPAGRPRHLRRAARRRARRRDRRAPRGRAAARDPRLRGARRRARAGARPLRQLLQPGALRRPDGPAVGARDRPRAPAGAVPRRPDVPPDVPLRVALEPARDGDPAARRAPLARAGARLHPRALPRAVLARPLLRRGAARRPGARDRAAAAQPGRRGGRLRGLADRAAAPAPARAPQEPQAARR